jgi:hypothetical protein
MREGGLYRCGAIRMSGQAIELGLIQAPGDREVLRLVEERFRKMYGEPWSSLFASNDPDKRDIPFDLFVRSWE